MDRPRSRVSFDWVFAIVLLMAAGVTAGGIYLAMHGQGWTVLAAGAVSTIATLLGWAIAGTIAASRRETTEGVREAVGPMAERLEQFSVMLNLISEQQLLSDRGKSIAYRNKDRDALRFAIQEEIAHGDYEAAWRLADEMENSFGNRQDAEHFRQLIEDKRSESVRKIIADSLAQVEQLVKAERWAAARRQAEQLQKRFGDHEQVRNLAAEIENHRQQFKNQLLKSFHDAVGRNDNDGAIELLKRLDAYLSTSEAEDLQETARTILRAKMEQFRSQFAAAVHVSNWSEALRIGDAIIRDFPNTQMAKEVREHMDTLRNRAKEPAAAQG